MLQFKIHGQGIFLFTTPRKCTINVLSKINDNGISFYFGDTMIVNLLPSNDPLPDPLNTSGFVPLENVYYWVCLDSQNKRIYAGIGEPRPETVIYRYTITKQFLEGITHIQYSESVKPLHVLKDPILCKVPMLIKKNMTLTSIAKGDYLPHSHLSPVGQRLYDCISGDQFILNEPDFRNFGKAIEKSVQTPGYWCYEKLKSKQNEFGDDPNMTYLRITLGQNNGESPGMEYVMEIWPPGHYSPVHSHAGAHAIIKVLRGKIHVSLYSFLNKTIEPFKSATFEKKDITWISPTLNQTHQLHNKGTKTCVTIQCYMYPGNDTTHYDYFDYLDTSGNEKQYTPDSDCEFLEFKNIIKMQK